MIEKTGNRAAIYARISRDKKDDGETLDGQIALCQDLAADNGLEVVAIYREPDGTGASERSKKKPEGRVEYDRMLAAARAGEFEHILAYADDRLTRRPKELEELIDLVDETKISIRTHRYRHYDLSTTQGIIAARILGAVAAGEARTIAERQRVTFERNAYAGKPKLHRQRAFGWEADGTTLREDEAALIRQAIEEIKAGATIASIRHRWNQEGVRTAVDPEQSKKDKKPDGHWEWSVLYRTLLGWRTAGIRTRHREPLRDRDGNLVRGTWEPIISLADRDQALAALARHARVKLRTGSWPLAGLLRCGECSAPLYGQLPSGSRSRAIYGCKKGHVGISAGLLEQHLIKEVVARAYRNRTGRAAEPAKPRTPEDWPKNDVLLAKTEKSREIWDAYKQDRLPASIAFPEVDELALEIKELQRELAEFLAVQPAPVSPLRRSSELLEWLLEMQGPFLRVTPRKADPALDNSWTSIDTPEEQTAASDSPGAKAKHRPQELPYAATPEETEELNRTLRAELVMVVIKKGKAGRQSEEQFRARIDPVWRD